jgi:hypothetical protein
MKANILIKKLVLLLAGLSVVGLFCVVAYAQSIPTILGFGDTPHSQVVDGPARLTARRLLILPGTPPSAWHYHPGILLSVIGNEGSPAPNVNRGAVTIEDGCGGSETYGPGQAFEQMGGRVHRAVNYSAETVEEHNMFINRQDDLRLTVNIPGDAPLCGPPLSVNECKTDGWMNFTFPRSFSSQGACIQYVNTGN